MQKTFRQELIEAFNESGSDKEWNHSYSFGYNTILFDQVNVKNILEIGLANLTIEKTSLNAWASIYPEAKIYGIDNDADKMVESDRIKTFLINQSNFNGLVNWAHELGVEFDIIIDDGSHIFEDAKTSFEALFNRLAPGGVYVIEDVAKSDKCMAIPNQQTVDDWKQYLEKIDGIDSAIRDCRKDSHDDSILIEIRKRKS